MARAQPRIVLAEAYSEDAVARLRARAEVIDAVGAGGDTLRAGLRDADALLVRTYLQVDEALLAAAPRLRVVGRGGVGLDNIDVAAARARGITVVYTPAASTRAVAEHTIALLLAVERRIAANDAAVRANRFREARGGSVFRELAGLTVGIVGMGRIGSVVGGIAARGLGMRVRFNDIVAVGPFDYPATSVAREQLFAESDVVTLHVPLTQATRGMIDAGALRQFKPGAVLLNTARGAIVDAVALAEALNAGTLAGAGIDVFDPEPLGANHPLLAAPNTVFSPHAAGRSAAALARMNDVVDDVLAVLAGEPARHAAQAAGW